MIFVFFSAFHLHSLFSPYYTLHPSCSLLFLSVDEFNGNTHEHHCQNMKRIETHIEIPVIRIASSVSSEKPRRPRPSDLLSSIKMAMKLYRSHPVACIKSRSLTVDTTNKRSIIFKWRQDSLNYTSFFDYASCCPVQVYRRLLREYSAILSSETSVIVYKATWHHIPEKSILYRHCI